MEINMKRIALDKGIVESLIVMAAVVEAKDLYTGGHIWRVSQYAKQLAVSIGLDKNEIFMTEIGGLVHDVGKVAIPDYILNKKSKLTDGEYKIIQTHTEIGSDMLHKHPLYNVVRGSIANHHQRVDGKGYPLKDRSSELQIIPKIISIADAFDAMTSKRSYRDPMKLDKVKQIMLDEKDKQFDCQLVNGFIHLLEEGNLNGVLGHSYEGSMMMSCKDCGPVIDNSEGLHDGQIITCPVCKGSMRVHMNGSDYELEFIGKNETYVPKVKTIVASKYVEKMPQFVRC
jgi:putative nucleotidyltransferase with HDIG domain